MGYWRQGVISGVKQRQQIRRLKKFKVRYPQTQLNAFEFLIRNGKFNFQLLFFVYIHAGKISSVSLQSLFHVFLLIIHKTLNWINLLVQECVSKAKKLPQNYTHISYCVHSKRTHAYLSCQLGFPRRYSRQIFLTLCC